MKQRLPISFSRISWRAAVLAVALFLGLFFHYLPYFLNLDQFRPEIVELLETTCHCKVLVGNVTLQLVPSPGLAVGPVIFLELSPTPRVLASVRGVRFWISGKTLEGRLRFRSIRFSKPRFIMHRERDLPGETRWTALSLPRAGPAGSRESVNQWEIRDGSVEIWDHTVSPTSKWIINYLNGSFQTNRQTGAVTGNMDFLGPRSHMDLHYDGSAALPLQARLSDVELEKIQSLIHAHVPALDGSAEFLVKARIQPKLEIQATTESLLFTRMPGTRVHAAALIQNDHWHARLQAGATAPMTLVFDGHFPGDRWDFQAEVQGYDAGIIKKFYDQRWTNQLAGGGSVTASARSGAAPGIWNWSATGHNFDLAGTAFHLPEWSAKGDQESISVDVQAATEQGGAADVTWTRSRVNDDVLLDVDTSSVTIRQILEIFNLQSSSRAPTAWNPFGYEPWRISRGSLSALIHPTQSLEVQEGHADITGMHLDLAGTFDLAKGNPQASIQGTLQNIPVALVAESFFSPPSPLTGTAQVAFTCAFPLSARWIQGLNGPFQVQVDYGVLRVLKTAYRIMSVLNLGNYLRLRMPQVSAQGILFETITGHLNFQNGVLSSDDLFLKSPNMNIGAKGSVDIPGQRIETTLRVEMFRFLEDILKNVPVTHWLFKKPNKIFLPLVVTAEGPWNNVDIH